MYISRSSIAWLAIHHVQIRKVGRKITGLTDDVIGGYYMLV
jgi:hypothetical protein